ncbi:hypothetical protein CYLTODRAFT_441160 [Cylindrobasidium torrendii FP15055 ss-10]|uniref:F-box domain-containing protein n=1 Tax=Cylindrobasidium torrendii FP15055 ss-10 TaxID=1314674 RepID=A0A0D7BN99_9AGAR|nr:hypothetical protein CYLTODRAFT_441160 [Cylindrobasidium torrendii FP15055 ss-10]
MPDTRMEDSDEEVMAMLRSGRIPTASEREPIQDQLQDLEVRFLQLQRKLELRKAVLAPIRRLPPEIMLNIFAMLPGEVSADASRAVVGRVSRRWRDLSRSSPSVWSHMTIDTTGSRPPNIVFFGQTLLLSRQAPLNITVICPHRDTDQLKRPLASLRKKVFDILKVHAPRFRSLQLINPDAVSIERVAKYRLVNLQSLTLVSTSIPENRNNKFNITTHQPLRYLHLDGSTVPIPAITLNIQWESLSTLTISFDGSARCYETLSQAENLENLTIQHIGRAGRRAISGPPVLFSRLGSLSLSDCALSALPDGLRFPGLVTLFLEHDPMDCRGKHDPARLEMLLSAWQCNITAFHYTGLNSVRDFERLFTQAGQTLQTLSVAVELPLGFEDEHWIGLEWLFRELNLYGRNPNTPIFLSQLRSFTLACHTEVHSDVFFSEGTDLSDALVSRQHNPATKLQAFHLTVNAFRVEDASVSKAVTSPLAAALRDLTDNGMRASWMYFGKDILRMTGALASLLA